MANHFQNEYYRGVVDLRFVALYLFLAALLLYFTVQVLSTSGPGAGELSRAATRSARRS